jgi:hypothetical protein
VRHFSSKQKQDLIRHTGEVNRKFNKLVRWEVLPFVGLAACLVGYNQFKPQIENLLFGNMTALSPKDLRFVGRKISGFLNYTYAQGRLSLHPDLIEV